MPSPRLHAALCAVLLSLPVVVNPALADSPAEPHILTVTGHGEAKGVPDRATISTGVSTAARTAAAALSANAKAMSAVFAALKQAGIPEKNIQTSNFEVTPQYAEQKAGSSAAPRIVGYQVSNTVSVTVDGLDKLGATIDALVAAGSNQIDGPSFSIADPKPLQSEARTEAVKDAADKAQTLARAAGVSLGPIIAISEGLAPETIRPLARGLLVNAAPVTPIAAGEQSLSADVTITWEIH